MISGVRSIVVGGHSRNTGKTSLVVDIIHAFPEAQWTAVKITQFGHHVCSSEGEPCDCAPDGQDFALSEELTRGGKSDTSRFLSAGAARSLWLRTKEGRLAEALPALREQVRPPALVIFESNAILQFVRPDLYLAILDASVPDFKESARLHFSQCNALILRRSWEETQTSFPLWGIPSVQFDAKPKFFQPIGAELPNALRSFVADALFSKKMEPVHTSPHLSS